MRECLKENQTVIMITRGIIDFLPMTEFLSAPKAQIQCDPLGTWNREKLHFELKYFGRRLWAADELKERLETEINLEL